MRSDTRRDIAPRRRATENARAPARGQPLPSPTLRRMRRKPLEARSKRRAVAGFDDESADAVFDDLRHACDARADDRRRARHRFEQRLPEKLRHVGMLPIRSAIDARQHEAQRPPVHCPRAPRRRVHDETRSLSPPPALSATRRRRSCSAGRRCRARSCRAAPQSNPQRLCAAAGGRRTTPWSFAMPAGPGLNFTVSTPPRITRAHGLSS